jgi:CheY-like chemotaxis protein
MLAMLLKKSGVASDAVENGQLALDMVAASADLDKYAVIFMDNMMPVMVSERENTIRLHCMALIITTVRFIILCSAWSGSHSAAPHDGIPAVDRGLDRKCSGG